MFWDAAHTGSTAEQTVWARFMEAAGSVLASTLGDDIEELRRKWEAEREARRIEEEKRRDEETRQRIIAAITSRATQDRREAEQRVASLNDAIDSYKRELVGKIRQLDTARRQLDALKNGEVDYTKKAVAEIDAIGKLHGVERFEVDGDLMKIYTTKLLCYDGRGNAYQLGRFRIELKLGTSDVRFFGLDPEYCRHAFWSGADPHPHVDGSNGRPCIGNLAETVAILTAQYELAALTSLLVNWLEACNTSDSAGARVTAWDKVNPDTGEAVVDGSDDYYEFHCEECGAGVDEDDTYRCYHCDEIFCEEHAHFIDAIDDYVCTTCRDENYTYCAECHTWVHNDNATEVVNQRGEIIYVCARCRDDHYEHCEDCGRYMYQDHMRYIDDIGRAVCDDCANDDDGDYAPCSTCGEWYLKDNLDEDGNCEDCHVEHDGEDSPEAAMERHDIMTTTVVADDDFAAEVLAAATADMVTCQFCGQLLLPEQLMTCEQCGEQGCGDCVKFSDIDGQYRCPTHR
jgi:hypothetical protein